MENQNNNLNTNTNPNPNLAAPANPPVTAADTQAPLTPNTLDENNLKELIKPKKSNGFLIFILFLLLLAASASAAFFGYKYFELFKEKSSLSSIIIPSASPSIEPAILTKNYKNETLGFSFDYPVDWEIKETESNKNVSFGPAGTSEEKTLLLKSKIILTKLASEPSYWALNIFSSPLNETLSSYKLPSPGGACSVTKTNDISLNNKSGKENVLECSAIDTPNNSTFLNYEWFIEHQGNTFVFSPGNTSNNPEVLKNIYSSFKFIEISPSTNSTESSTMDSK